MNLVVFMLLIFDFIIYDVGDDYSTCVISVNLIFLFDCYYVDM
jgi:hypothetical protein